MQAIILAGGLGTRLRSVVSDRPKPMALVLRGVPDISRYGAARLTDGLLTAPKPI